MGFWHDIFFKPIGYVAIGKGSPEELEALGKLMNNSNKMDNINKKTIIVKPKLLEEQ